MEQQQSTSAVKHAALYRAVACAVMAALMGAVAPLSIPLKPVPITLGTMMVLLAAQLLGWRWGTVSVLVYLLMGAVGLPVFSGYLGGLSRLAGPTGGYLIGYLPLALIAGAVCGRTRNRFLQALGMIAGVLACYLLGTVWFCLQGGYTVGVALTKCVTPFLPFDAAKIAVVLVLGPILKDRLVKAKLLP